MDNTKVLIDAITSARDAFLIYAKSAEGHHATKYELANDLRIQAELIDAALASQGEAAQPAADETAWLIELRGNVPSWWSLDPDEEPGWLRDADKALRFARREDAENYINDMGWNDVFATEHMWCTSPNGIASQEKGSGWEREQLAETLENIEDQFR